MFQDLHVNFTPFPRGQLSSPLICFKDKGHPAGVGVRRRYISNQFATRHYRKWMINTTLRSLCPRERPCTQRAGGWAGVGADLDAMEKSRLRWNSIPVASRIFHRTSLKPRHITFCYKYD